MDRVAHFNLKIFQHLHLGKESAALINIVKEKLLWIQVSRQGTKILGFV